jgi:hypothetical protein
MRRLVGLATVFVPLVGLAFGCRGDADGDGDGGGGGLGCVSIDGDWVVVSHCEPTLAGVEVGVIQTGCDIATTGAFDNFAGAVDQDDNLTLSGTAFAGGDLIECAGSAAPTELTFACTDSCDVVLERPGTR